MLTSNVVQETVVGVARKIGEFNADPKRGSFKSWLLGQARWRIGDQFRARARQKRFETPNAPPAATDDSPGIRHGDSTSTEVVHRIADPAGDRLEEVWNEEWELHVLRTALGRIKTRVSVKQFQLFDLHVRQGLSVTETARAVGTT